MTAKEAIQFVVEGKAPNGWATTYGIYGNFSRWPAEVDWYVKCPKCGLIHGNYKTMRDAHSKKLCDICNLDAINKLKDEIQDVVHDPEHKPKEMLAFAEGIEYFDPFDTPAEDNGVPLPPEDDPTPNPADTKGEIERLLMSNWVDIALRLFASEEDFPLSDLTIDVRWSEREGNYDAGNLAETLALKIEVDDREYLIFKDDDEAYNYALKIVRNELESEPELFTQSWLRDFVDKDRLKKGIGDPYEYWENDVRNLDYPELLEKLVEEGKIDSDDPVFFKQNGDPRIENPVRIKALNGFMEAYIESDKPTVEPWDWLRDIYGEEEAVKQAIAIAGVDVDKAAQSAVDTGGVAHFLAHYDHAEHQLENGAMYYRIS